ncbi:MAG: formate/nitrite transporter family protein [Lachnospiraceae bacterium]|nr:formate/nitrite transporter family protein [Lachnospiraceae bacterium]
MKAQAKKYIRMLLLAILSGITIGVGGTVFLSAESRVVGAVLFTVGLYTICIQGLNLFTGKVGYLFDNKPIYLVELLVIWIGNFLGTAISAALILQTRISGIADTARSLCEVKLQDSYVSLFVLGIFCGMLMFIAVDGFKKTNGNPVILFLGVVTFILCGFEHCIADMFYFTLAGMWSVKALLCILVITLGNSVGGVLIPLVKKFPEK